MHFLLKSEFDELLCYQRFSVVESKMYTFFILWENKYVLLSKNKLGFLSDGEREYALLLKKMQFRLALNRIFSDRLPLIAKVDSVPVLRFD